MEFSHVDKIWFPKSEITKQDVIAYYQKISPYFLQHVQNRLIVLQRYPDGIDHDFFYQKQISDFFPKFVGRKTINLKKGDKQTLVIINSQETLLYLVNLGTITFHSWLSSSLSVDKPNKIVFDLDPSHDDLSSLRLIARALKKRLEEYELVPFVMTTGSKGYHVVVPIYPKHSFQIIHEFAKQVAGEIAAAYPKLATISPTKSERVGKIFIDYLRNSYGQTSVAPYSVKPLENAPVATPILWDQLSRTSPQKYTIKNIFTFLKKYGDAWADFDKQRRMISLKKVANSIK